MSEIPTYPECDHSYSQMTDRCSACLVHEVAALETENARLMSELAGSKAQEKATDDMLSEELEERDARNDHVAETASMLGCEEEWSNLHDHYDCIRMAAMVDRSYRESVDETIGALRTENRALREALESIAGMWPDEAERRAKSVAEAALAAGRK